MASLAIPVAASTALDNGGAEMVVLINLHRAAVDWMSAQRNITQIKAAIIVRITLAQTP